MNSSCSAGYPEDPTPAMQKDCRDCGLYEQGSRMIWGEGTPGAPLMVILDNPGAREDREGNPMVCGTRQTLHQAIAEAGIAKEQVYVTYILKRKPVRAYDKERTRMICMQHLTEQLREQRPSLIVCLGNVAVQSFYQNSEVDVKGLRGSWQEIDGIQTTVAYHPLAARRRPNLYPLLLEDMRLVAEKLKEVL